VLRAPYRAARFRRTWPAEAEGRAGARRRRRRPSGSPLIQYLAAAGIGEIGVLDDDEVSLSNLQRQVLHGTADIGRANQD